MHPRGSNATDYAELRKRAAPLLDDHVAPLTEAHSVLDLVRTGTITVMEARELIEFPESARRALIDIGVPGNLIDRAADYRGRVLANFDNLYACGRESLVRCSRRGRPAVGILDKLRRTPEPAPARPEDQPGKSMRDVCADSGGLCVECQRRVAQRAVGDRALCTVCWYREMTLQPSAG